MALGIVLLAAGLVCVLAGLPALAARVVWRRTRGLRERGVERAAALLAEHHQPRAGAAGSFLLGAVEIAVRRRLLPWLVLLATGGVAMVAGIVLIVAG